MSLLKRLRSVLGLNGADVSDADDPATVTIEHEATISEREVADSDDTVAEQPPVSPPAPEDAPTPTYEGELTDISGIGPAYSDRLSDAGIDSVEALARADPARVAADGDLPESRVADWIADARELTGTE